MPRQQRRTDGGHPVSLRLGVLQRDRLNQLIELRQQNQTTVFNAAIDLLWLFDIGFVQVDAMKQADALTSYGQDDVN